MNKEIPSVVLAGRVIVPPSKSDAQRAILAAGLANGQSVLSHTGTSNDVRAMIRNIRQFGAEVYEEGESLVITGTTNFPEQLYLNCGESGLGLRLMAGVCAAHHGRYELTGEGSILRRTHSFFTESFPKWGVAAALNEGHLPLRLSGRLRGGNLEANGSASSQYVSGLLMGLPLVDEDSILKVNGLTSRPYVDMTLSTLETFGIRIVEDEKDTFCISGNQQYRATAYTIEGDWSAAAYWLTAAAIGHPVKVAGLQKESLQADKALLQALESAGCEVHWNAEELAVNATSLRAFTFDATHCPDLFPALVTLAAFCPGVSVIKGLGRLANKESDRGKALQEEFGKLGLTIELKGDEMHIYGGTPLHSGRVNSHEDHRMAMCLSIAGTRIPGGIVIEGAEAVSKSYPGFWEDLTSLAPAAH